MSAYVNLFCPDTKEAVGRALSLDWMKTVILHVLLVFTIFSVVFCFS